MASLRAKQRKKPQYFFFFAYMTKVNACFALYTSENTPAPTELKKGSELAQATQAIQDRLHLVCLTVPWIRSQAAQAAASSEQYSARAASMLPAAQRQAAEPRGKHCPCSGSKAKGGLSEPGERHGWWRGRLAPFPGASPRVPSPTFLRNRRRSPRTTVSLYRKTAFNGITGSV